MASGVGALQWDKRHQEKSLWISNVLRTNALQVYLHAEWQKRAIRKCPRETRAIMGPVTVTVGACDELQLILRRGNF